MQPPESPPLPGSLAALRARHGPRHRWLLLAAVMVGTMASVMSSTVINVGIPGLSAHFAVGQAQAQWVTSGFMVAMTVSMLTTPWLLMRFGYRAVYVGTMLLLLVGGLLGGLASQFTWVLVARVAEGLAAGVVQPIPAIIIMRAFEPHEQGRASGFFGTGVVLAPALGPSLGGLLVDFFGWRSLFFMVVPFCLLAIWMAYRYVPSTAPGGVQPDSDGDALDWRGLALASTSTLALLNGLVHLHEGVSVASVGLLGFALACLLLFVFWQKRLAARGEVGLMNLALFDVRSFAMGSLVSAIYGAALFGSTYLLPVYMQSALKLAPSLVGAILLPAGLVLAVVIAIVGRLADKVPGYLLVTVGLALLASSFVSMDLVEPLSPLWLLVALSILGRVGLGFILPSLNIGAMRGLPKPMIAQGASVINFVRTLGGAAGVSLCGIALEWRLQVHGDRLSNPVTTQARLDAFGEVFWMLGLTCALAILASWKLREPG